MASGRLWAHGEPVLALDLYAVRRLADSIDETGALAAFIWRPEHGMRALQEVLVTDYGLDLTGWRLREACGLSDDGRTIVGVGINPQGVSEAWIARIPEPSTAVLLLAVFARCAARRRGALP